MAMATLPTSTNRRASTNPKYAGVSTEVPSPPELPSCAFVSDHALRSKIEGDSEVERVTQAIEQRRKNRIVITKSVRIALLKDCRHIAKDKGYKVRSKIHYEDLREYRDLIKGYFRLERGRPLYYIRSLLGLRNQNEQLLRVLERALEVVVDQGSHDPFFYYLDFNEYHTVVESSMPWKRHPLMQAFIYIFLFYFLTPLYFCNFLEDEGICPREEGNSYSGWLGALYFASTTISTVGYGDLSVDKTNPWHVFAGTVYMVAANLVLIGSFSIVIEKSSKRNPLADWSARLRVRLFKESKTDEPLYMKIRRIKYLKLAELYGSFILLILIGVFANRLFLLEYEEGELGTDWTWMVSVYWAVQTATTVGYGDLDQPPNQRWFQIFYLILASCLFGRSLQGMVGLREEIEEVRREYAWKRRDVSSNLIDEFQADDNDGKVDQYEFLVASLVQLGKITSEDVTPIMNKYRSLAGDDGYISKENNGLAVTDEEIQDTIDQEVGERLPFQILTGQSFRWPFGGSHHGLFLDEYSSRRNSNPTESGHEDLESGTNAKSVPVYDLDASETTYGTARELVDDRSRRAKLETAASETWRNIGVSDIIKMLAFETSAPPATR